MQPTPRSYLFVPGDRPDRFDKAHQSGADAVILDLEDSVSGPHKQAARDAVWQALDPDQPSLVRVNAMATEWFEADFEAVMRPGLLGIVLPKAENPATIAELVGRAQGAALVLLVETALGVWNVRRMADVKGVTRLAFGAIDFQIDARVEGDREALIYARSRIVLASRVAGLPAPIDGVTVALADPRRLGADVEYARRLGFGAKLCVHPAQVDPVNRGFGPSAAEVTWAERVVDAAATAETAAFQLDGELVDIPVIERARRILVHAAAQREEPA